jgi:hypothetical protein
MERPVPLMDAYADLAKHAERRAFASRWILASEWALPNIRTFHRFPVHGYGV